MRSEALVFALSIPEILIHETIWPETVCQYRSHGCIRVHPEHMEPFFGVMEPGVLNLLRQVKDRYGAEKRIHVVSGYRSPAYNDLLRKRGHRVAGGSCHLRGLAVDFVLPGVGNHELFPAARSLEVGGVGNYPEFVHIDFVPVRSW